MVARPLLCLAVMAHASTIRSLFAILALTAATLSQTACTCGMALDPAAANDGGVAASADITDGGVVEFTAVAVGASESYPIPVKDTADSDETITGARIEGTDAAAFQILSTFPIAVPAGQPTVVEVQFAPARSGAASAELILQTAGMGESTIPLAGTGGASQD